jgi:hypothetical protein
MPGEKEEYSLAGPGRKEMTTLNVRRVVGRLDSAFSPTGDVRDQAAGSFTRYNQVVEGRNDRPGLSKHYCKKYAQ